MIVTLFSSVYANIGHELELASGEFIDLILSSDIVHQRSRKEMTLSFTSCRFNGTRSKANAYDASAIALDIDNGWTLDQAVRQAGELNCPAAIYTTTKHRDEHNKFRLVFPLHRVVQAWEYEELWYGLSKRFEPHGCVIDRQTKDISRLSIMPASWSGDMKDEPPFPPVAPFAWGCKTGDPLDVDAILKAYSRDPVESLPVAPCEPTFINPMNTVNRSYRHMLNSTVDRHDLCDLNSSPIVPQSRLSEEMMTRDSGRTFRLLCACALSGLSQGYCVDEYVLTSLGEQFSRLVRRNTTGLENDVRNALASARLKLQD